MGRLETACEIIISYDRACLEMTMGFPGLYSLWVVTEGFRPMHSRGDPQPF